MSNATKHGTSSPVGDIDLTSVISPLDTIKAPLTFQATISPSRMQLVTDSRKQSCRRGVKFPVEGSAP